MADKTAIIVRVDRELRAEIEQAAAEQHRNSLANMVAAVLLDWSARRAAAGQPAQTGEQQKCAA